MRGSITIQCEYCENSVKYSENVCKIYADNKPKYILNGVKECLEFKHHNPLIINSKSDFERSILGGIFGFCVADAIGVPVEFTPREILKLNPVSEMRGYGTYNQPFGTWSDDSSMLLCTFESLKDKYDLKDIAYSFCRFYDYGYLTPYNEVFDIGNTTAIAIQKIKHGIDLRKCGGNDERDNGNGSLMRMLPLAYYLRNKDHAEKVNIIEEVSSLTYIRQKSPILYRWVMNAVWCESYL